MAMLLPSASFARETKPGHPKPEAEQTTAPVAAQPDTTSHDGVANMLPASLDDLPLESGSESDSESIVVIEEEPSSLQGAVGGAPAQPSTAEMMEQILQQQKAQAEKVKKLQAENERLKAQQETAGNTASDNPLGALCSRLTDCGEAKKWSGLLRKKEQEKPNANFLSNLLEVTLNGGITQGGQTVNEMLQGQQAETQGAAAASSQSAPETVAAELFTQIFGGARNNDRSATDKATEKTLGFLRKL
ncbi:MAG: hypothetical protein V6Z78_04885 [Holosporaceae bacterium]